MRIRVAKENWFTHKNWGNGNRAGNMLSNRYWCIDVIEAVFLHENWFKLEYSYVFEKCLLISVFNSKRVQLVEQSFLGLIYVFRMDVSHSYTACSEMSSHKERSVEKSVTIRETKTLEDCINEVVDVAFVVVVSEQSHSVFVFLHTSSSRFSENVPIYNIYTIQQNIES